MAVVVVGLWFATAVAGMFMMGTWIANDRVRRGIGRRGRHRQFPGRVVYLHAAAAIGITIWFAYLHTGGYILAWSSVTVLTAVAVAGLTLFPRWFPSSHRRMQASRLSETNTEFFYAIYHNGGKPARLPIVTAIAHWLLAIATITTATAGRRDRDHLTRQDPAARTPPTRRR